MILGLHTGGFMHQRLSLRVVPLKWPLLPSVEILKELQVLLQPAQGFLPIGNPSGLSVRDCLLEQLAHLRRPPHTYQLEPHKSVPHTSALMILRRAEQDERSLPHVKKPRW